VTPVLVHGPWRVAVRDDEAAARYSIADWLEWSDRVAVEETESGRARAVVEVRRSGGGLLPLALVGGEMIRTGDDSRRIRVGQSSGMTLGSVKACRSAFGGSLVPGLPPEFAQATLDGAVRVPADWKSGAELVVDRGAYDEVDSAGVAFERAGGLLVLTLLARLDGSDLDASLLERLSSAEA